MGIISDRGIEIKCPYCGATQEREFDVQMHYRWKNAHGVGIRVFCQLCGQWTDFTNKKGEIKSVVIRKPLIPEIKKVSAVYNDADALFRAKIAEAKEDISNTENMLRRPQLIPGIEDQYREHLRIMRSYLFDVERQRGDLYMEYKTELNSLKANYESKA